MAPPARAAARAPSRAPTFRLATLARAGLAALVLVFVLRSAWVCDDAYITLRVSDNLAHGLGPTWNPGERVQAYSNPLWMLVLSGSLSVVGEPYVALLGASLATSALFVALFLRWHVGERRWGALGLLVLAGSKSFVDYSTSGLENPLSHLLVAWGYRSLVDAPPDLRRLRRLSMAASLCACDRIDLVLLFLPAVASDLAARWRTHPKARVLSALALGASPFLAWEAFSLFYYGSLVPNTAYAKLATGVPLSEYLAHGWTYLLSTSATDPAGVAAIACALGLGLRSRRAWLEPARLGTVLSLAYLFRVGGDFMVGRSLTPLIVLAACALSRADLAPWKGRACAAIFLAAGSLAPLAPWRAGPDYDQGAVRELGVFRPIGGATDERGTFYQRTGLLRARRRSWNDHPWVHQGELLRAAAEQAPQAPIFAIAIGMAGFHAGPRVEAHDYFGLADALLGRLPIQAGQPWRIGHFARALPAGYRATVTTGVERIEDPALAAYHALLWRVVRGELWSRERLAAIWGLHFGATREGFDAYRERHRRGEVALDR